MAHKDYVSRSRTANKSRSNRKSSNNNKLIGIAVLIIILIAGLYVLTHYKLGHQQTNTPTKTQTDKEKASTALPPKPEERWSYIKELEGVQNGRSAAHSQTPTKIPTPLNNEQRQILQQMQAEQPAASIAPTQPAQPAQPKVKAVIPPVNTATQANSTTKPTPSKTPVATKPVQQKNTRWFLQCGSFQHQDQAESVRAKLAFAGIESRIQQDKTWSRIVLGPYSQHQQAINLQKKIVNNTQVHCITVTSKG